jgi:FtsH-binding integral membrane protein
MVQVFAWIAGALLLSAFFASYADRFHTDVPSILSGNLAFVLIGGLLAMVFAISRKAAAMMPGVAMATLAAYASLQGTLFGYVYRSAYGVSLAPVYLVSALVVGALAVYGLCSGADLIGIRSLLIGGVAAFAAALVGMLEFGLPFISACAACTGCWLMLSIVGYHRNFLRDLPDSFENDPRWEKAAVVGALQVYVDMMVIVLVIIQLRWLRWIEEDRDHTN